MLLTPEGFYMVPVEDLPRRGARRNENVCHFCDARTLCIENVDNWCRKHRCMPYDVKTPEGVVIKGRDKQIVYKKIQDSQN